MEILALRALALNAMGDADGANAILMQALDLAQQGGFIRVFVELGIPMQELLRRLEKQYHFAEMIRRILAASPEADVNPVSSAHRPSPGLSTLAEPLTPRELEVLTFLQEPSSIKEIALELNFSYGTARRHTINIYGKLGVNRRLDAVARAVELKILPPR